MRRRWKWPLAVPGLSCSDLTFVLTSDRAPKINLKPPFAIVGEDAPTIRNSYKREKVETWTEMKKTRKRRWKKEGKGIGKPAGRLSVPLQKARGSRWQREGGRGVRVAADASDFESFRVSQKSGGRVTEGRGDSNYERRGRGKSRV